VIYAPRSEPRPVRNLKALGILVRNLEEVLCMVHAELWATEEVLGRKGDKNKAFRGDAWAGAVVDCILGTDGWWSKYGRWLEWPMDGREVQSNE